MWMPGSICKVTARWHAAAAQAADTSAGRTVRGIRAVAFCLSNEFSFNDGGVEGRASRRRGGVDVDITRNKKSGLLSVCRRTTRPEPNEWTFVCWHKPPEILSARHRDRRCSRLLHLSPVDMFVLEKGGWELLFAGRLRSRLRRCCKESSVPRHCSCWTLCPCSKHSEMYSPWINLADNKSRSSSGSNKPSDISSVIRCRWCPVRAVRFFVWASCVQKHSNLQNCEYKNTSVKMVQMNPTSVK